MGSGQLPQLVVYRLRYEHPTALDSYLDKVLQLLIGHANTSVKLQKQ